VLLSSENLSEPVEDERENHGVSGYNPVLLEPLVEPYAQTERDSEEVEHSKGGQAASLWKIRWYRAFSVSTHCWKLTVWRSWNLTGPIWCNSR